MQKLDVRNDILQNFHIHLSPGNSSFRDHHAGDSSWQVIINIFHIFIVIMECTFCALNNVHFSNSGNIFPDISIKRSRYHSKCILHSNIWFNLIFNIKYRSGIYHPSNYIQVFWMTFYFCCLFCLMWICCGSSGHGQCIILMISLITQYLSLEFCNSVASYIVKITSATKTQ